METNNSICLKVYQENDVGLTRLKEREKVFISLHLTNQFVLPCLGLSNKPANNFFSISLSYVRPGTRFCLTFSQSGRTKTFSHTYLKKKENDMFQCNKIILGVKEHRENHWSVEIICTANMRHVCIVQIVSFNEIFVFNIKGPSQPVCFAGVESCGGHFHLYRNCSSQSPGYF